MLQSSGRGSKYSGCNSMSAGTLGQIFQLQKHSNGIDNEADMAYPYNIHAIHVQQSHLGVILPLYLMYNKVQLSFAPSLRFFPGDETPSHALSSPRGTRFCRNERALRNILSTAIARLRLAAALDCFVLFTWKSNRSGPQTLSILTAWALPFSRTRYSTLAQRIIYARVRLC